MKQVKTSEEALKVFDLLGIKEVTKEWQKKKGTRVFELPFKTMYYNGHSEINRFSVYHSGYVRKMVVYGKNNASMSCYQLNKQYKSKRKYFNSYYKEYQTFNTIKRAMIYNEDDRLVYLCNYILKNYYRNNKCGLVGEYTMKRIAEVHNDWHKMNTADDQLPFGDMVNPDSTPQDDVQVIINGHRYNLS